MSIFHAAGLIDCDGAAESMASVVRTAMIDGPEVDLFLLAQVGRCGHVAPPAMREMIRTGALPVIRWLGEFEWVYEDTAGLLLVCATNDFLTVTEEDFEICRLLDAYIRPRFGPEWELVLVTESEAFKASDLLGPPGLKSLARVESESCAALA